MPRSPPKMGRAMAVLTIAHWPLPTESNVGNQHQDLPVWYKNQQEPIL
jgi:hypothetical protein